MVAKRGTTRTRRRVVVAPPPPPSSTKSFPTAALGLGMVILTNYQEEVKQMLSLLIKMVCGLVQKKLF